MKYPRIASRFSYILTMRQMKANELAEKAGMTKAAISHYVNGNRCPTNKTAALLGKILDVNPLWLMDLSSEMMSNGRTPNPLERHYIEAYRELDEDSRGLVDFLIDILREERPDTDKVVEMIGKLTSTLHSN